MEELHVKAFIKHYVRHILKHLGAFPSRRPHRHVSVPVPLLPAAALEGNVGKGLLFPSHENFPGGKAAQGCGSLD